MQKINIGKGYIATYPEAASMPPKQADSEPFEETFLSQEGQEGDFEELVDEHGPTKPTTSSKISSFTPKSRNRLIKTLNNLENLPDYFTTLTTDQYQSLDWNKLLSTLKENLARVYPDGSFIWRIEPTSQGAPHLHILATPGAPEPKRYILESYDSILSTIWPRISHCQNIEHSINVRHCEPQHLTYITKPEYSRYTAKENEIWKGIKHRWGIVGRQNLPEAQVYSYQLTDSAFNQVKEFIWQCIERNEYIKPHSRAKMQSQLANTSAWFTILPPDDIAELRKLIKQLATGTS